jgi:hypothetical protein
MYYKSDWDNARERFEAFWNRELVDRCCCAVRAPRVGSKPYQPGPPPDTHEELVHRWIDPEYNLKQMIDQMECTYYGGESYPATTMCLGASVMAAFYGAEVEFRPETVWFHPVLNDLTAVDWEIDVENSPLYKETIAATRYYTQECRGRYLVGLPELGSATDDLSLIRGMQDLLFDMIDSPEAVKHAIAAMTKTWCRVHTELFEIAQSCNDGDCCIPWMQTWAPGTHYQISCDFSAIQSPEMFREFIIPELETYMTVNEYSVYHWDGPDALKHLDALLELPELKAIQWTPGEGQPLTGSECWLPYYKRIQAAGKCLILPFVQIDEVEALMMELSSKGLFMNTFAESEAEARALLGNVEVWTRE